MEITITVFCDVINLLWKHILPLGLNGFLWCHWRVFHEDLHVFGKLAQVSTRTHITCLLTMKKIRHYRICMERYWHVFGVSPPALSELSCNGTGMYSTRNLLLSSPHHSVLRTMCSWFTGCTEVDFSVHRHLYTGRSTRRRAPISITSRVNPFRCSILHWAHMVRFAMSRSTYTYLLQRIMCVLNEIRVSRPWSATLDDSVEAYPLPSPLTYNSSLEHQPTAAMILRFLSQESVSFAGAYCEASQMGVLLNRNGFNLERWPIVRRLCIVYILISTTDLTLGANSLQQLHEWFTRLHIIEIVRSMPEWTTSLPPHMRRHGQTVLHQPSDRGNGLQGPFTAQPVRRVLTPRDAFVGRQI